MKLIGSYTSPYVRKVSVILQEKGLAFDLVNVSPWEEDSRVIAVNPLGKVPVLITALGETIFDSAIIAEYLELTCGEPPLLPADPLHALRVRQLGTLADGVIDAAVAIMRECHRPAEQRSERLLMSQRDKIRRSLDALEVAAREAQWLNTPALSLADISVGCCLGFLNYCRVMPNWCVERAELVAMAGRLLARTSFARTAPPVATDLYASEML